MNSEFREVINIIKKYHWKDDFGFSRSDEKQIVINKLEDMERTAIEINHNLDLVSKELKELRFRIRSLEK